MRRAASLVRATTRVFEEAILDVDGTLVGTDAECKEGR